MIFDPVEPASQHYSYDDVQREIGTIPTFYGHLVCKLCGNRIVSGCIWPDTSK